MSCRCFVQRVEKGVSELKQEREEQSKCMAILYIGSLQVKSPERILIHFADGVSSYQDSRRLEPFSREKRVLTPRLNS